MCVCVFILLSFFLSFSLEGDGKENEWWNLEKGVKELNETEWSGWNQVNLGETYPAVV